MKKKSIFKKVIVICLILIILIGGILLFVLYQIQKKPYDAKITGKWTYTNDIFKYESQLIFKKDSVNYDIHNISDGTEVHKRGKYSLENINSNGLYHIVFSGEIGTSNYYKYYNYIGDYYKYDNLIPNTKYFSAVLERTYFWDKYEFNEDGQYKLYQMDLSTDENKYIEPQIINYYQEDNIIYNQDTGEMLFFVVDGGLFEPWYIKKTLFN